MKLIATAILSLAFLAPLASAQSVHFIEPQDGATLPSTFKVRFGLDGMTVAPAGDMSEGTGHHHLLINVPDIPEGAVIPMDERHLHFGKGQTETELTLPPGRHRLTMQFADGLHRSYGDALRKTIEVTVK